MYYTIIKFLVFCLVSLYIAYYDIKYYVIPRSIIIGAILVLNSIALIVRDTHYLEILILLVLSIVFMHSLKKGIIIL